VKISKKIKKILLSLPPFLGIWLIVVSLANLYKIIKGLFQTVQYYPQIFSSSFLGIFFVVLPWLTICSLIIYLISGIGLFFYKSWAYKLAICVSLIMFLFSFLNILMFFKFSLIAFFLPIFIICYFNESLVKRKFRINRAIVKKIRKFYLGFFIGMFLLVIFYFWQIHTMKKKFPLISQKISSVLYDLSSSSEYNDFFEKKEIFNYKLNIPKNLSLGRFSFGDEYGSQALFFS